MLFACEYPVGTTVTTKPVPLKPRSRSPGAARAGTVEASKRRVGRGARVCFMEIWYVCHSLPDGASPGVRIPGRFWHWRRALALLRRMDFSMPLDEAMRTQRAIRPLKPDPVDDVLVLRLIELALKEDSAY